MLQTISKQITAQYPQVYDVGLLLTSYNFTCLLFSGVIKTTCNLDSNRIYRLYRNTGTFLTAVSNIRITNGSKKFHTFDFSVSFSL